MRKTELIWASEPPKLAQQSAPALLDTPATNAGLSKFQQNRLESLFRLVAQTEDGQWLLDLLTHYRQVEPA